MGLLALLAASAAVAAGEPSGEQAVTECQGGLDPSRVGWRRLEFSASKFGLTTTSWVTFELVPAAEAAEQLIAAAEGGRALAPAGDSTGLLGIGSQLFSRRTDGRLLFDPADGTALQRVQHESGKRDRYKVYRFTEEGVYTVWRYPEDGEAELLPQRWSDRRDAVDAYPQPLPDLVTEPSSLFYLVSAGDLERVGDRLEVLAFSKHQVYRVSATVEAVERIEVDYVEEGPGGQRRVKGTTDALRIALAANSRTGDGEPLNLIGLEGDVNLYLERRHRAPVLVTGKVKVVGRVNVRLQRLVVR
jgi:hypothetical protein